MLFWYLNIPALVGEIVVYVQAFMLKATIVITCDMISELSDRPFEADFFILNFA